MSAERELLVAIESTLIEVDQSIGLLESFRPLDHDGDVRWLTRALAGGVLAGAPPEARFAGARPLTRARAQLQAAGAALETVRSSVVAAVLLDRTRELELELRLIDARGTSAVQQLSRLRFGEGDVVSSQLALKWVQEGVEEDGVDDVVDLASELVRLCREMGIDIPVVPRRMAARAAVTNDAFLVREGVRVHSSEALRIFVHELEGHLLPRRHGRLCGPPFRVGSAGGNSDEEGRALLLEERSGLLGARRRRELGARHLAAVWVREGEDAWGVARRLVAHGVREEESAEIALRVGRGGGLAREIVYLPALLRVRSALETEPELESFLKAGPISVSAARSLRDAGIAPAPVS